MSRPELNQTLTALVDAIPDEAGMSVFELDLHVPLEMVLTRIDGQLVVLASPGHTRFVSGFLPALLPTHLRIVAEPET